MENEKQSNEYEHFFCEDVKLERSVSVTVVQIISLIASIACYYESFFSTLHIGEIYFVAGTGWLVVWALCKWPRFLFEEILVRRQRV